MYSTELMGLHVRTMHGRHDDHAGQARTDPGR